MHRVRHEVQAFVGGLPGAFWWVWTSALVSSLGGFVVPFLAIWLTAERGHSATTAGVVGTVFGLGSVVGAIVGGVSADRWGRRPTVLAAQVIAAAGVLVMGLAPELPVILAMAFVVGLGTNATRPARTAMMADLVPAIDRVRAFSLNYWAINLGFAFATVVAGVLAGVSYQLLFFGNAIALLLCAAVVFLRVPETRPAVSATPAVVKESGGLLDVLRDRVFMVFVGLTFLIALIFMQHATAMPLAMSDSGLSAAAFGSVIAINGLLIVLLQLPLGRIAEQFPRSRVLAVAAVLVGVGFALNNVANSAVAYALVVCIWTVGEVLNAPTSMAVVADLSPAGMRGRYQGVYSVAWSGAAFVAPLGGGWLYDHSPVLLWGACAVLGLGTALGHLSISGARGKRIAALRSQGEIEESVATA